jgi:DNA-binding transcriptional MocR family regulator
VPEAFDEACRAGPVRALVCIPTFTNPTGHLAGAERRRQIAEVARHHGVFVIEDEVYKPLLDQPMPSIADMVPEIGFFATSFTKSVMTGLRTGYLVVPPQLSIRAASILRVTGWSGTVVVAEMAARWIENGTAEALLAVQRSEVRARHAIVADVLGPLAGGCHPLSLGIWLKIPEHWNEETLVRVLRERGVAATPSEPFVVGGAKGRRGMRLSIGGRMSHASLRHALETVRSTFHQLPPINETGFLS